MSGKERTLLIASLVLNAVLLIVLIFTFVNGSTASTSDSVAQIAPTATETAQAPTATRPTQTPVVITVVATPTEIKVIQITPETVINPTEMPSTKLAETSVPTETNAPTQTPEPTTEPSPTPTPQPTEAVFTGPDWLRYTNQFRAQAGLPLLVEDSQLSEGAANHSYYMVVNSSSSHNEDVSLPGYTDSGLQAGQNGNIAVSGVAGTTYYWPIDYWISAAFHAIPILNPALAYTGYGEHSDVNSSFGMAATLDIKNGLREEMPDSQYPIMFPRDGGKTWVTSYSMPEFPNTATGCSGYQKPTGAPIILMLGDGENTPQIHDTQLLGNGNPIPHCAFDETNYYNPEPYWQGVGRTILDHNDTVVLLPRSPLNVGQEYTVTVNNGGEAIEWAFTVVEHPITAVSETGE